VRIIFPQYLNIVLYFLFYIAPLTAAGATQ